MTSDLLALLSDQKHELCFVKVGDWMVEFFCDLLISGHCSLRHIFFCKDMNSPERPLPSELRKMLHSLLEKLFFRVDKLSPLFTVKVCCPFLHSAVNRTEPRLSLAGLDHRWISLKELKAQRLPGVTRSWGVVTVSRCLCFLQKLWCFFPFWRPSPGQLWL